MPDDLTVLEEALNAFGGAPTLQEDAEADIGGQGDRRPHGRPCHRGGAYATQPGVSHLHDRLSLRSRISSGVTHGEISGRCAVARTLFERLGSGPQAKMVVTYPPLVNVFAAEALRECGIEWSFLKRSSRDALIVAFCREQPDIVLGESSFLRATLEQVGKLGLKAQMPKKVALLCAGTPLDQELLPVAEAYGYSVHDLYGCQEFGWLTLDGVPLRDDIMLVASPRWGRLPASWLSAACPWATASSFPNPAMSATGPVKSSRISASALIRNTKSSFAATTAHAASTVEKAGAVTLKAHPAYQGQGGEGRAGP